LCILYFSAAPSVFYFSKKWCDKKLGPFGIEKVPETQKYAKTRIPAHHI
jgi:hypothetical protein